MENVELSFKLTSNVEGIKEGATQATESLRSVGKEYDDAKKKSEGAKGSADALGKAQKGQGKAAQESADAQKKANAEMATSVAVTTAATTVFLAIVGAVRKGVDAYVQYQNAMMSLSGVADKTNTSMNRLYKATSDLTADGLMLASDVSYAIKNLLMYGYTVDQTIDIIERLKDSAAYNRQANYSLGEAVKMTTEGIRMENSILSDAAGVTKNIAKMYEEYAQSLGVSSTALTQAQKAQGVYNGIMKETEVVQGNAAKYSQQFAGEQSKLEAAQRKVNQAFGGAATGVLSGFYSALSTVLGGLASFIEQHRIIAVILTSISLAVTGLIALYGLKAAALKLLGITATGTAADMYALASSFAAVWATSGPPGWIILAIAGVAAAISFVAAACAEAKKYAEDLRKEIQTISESNRGASALIEEFEILSQKVGKTTEETQRMKDIRAQLVEQYGYSAAAVDEEGRLLAGNLEVMKAQLATQKELLIEKLKANQANEEATYNDALSKRKALLEELTDAQSRLNDKQAYEGMGEDGAGFYRISWEKVQNDALEAIEAGNADMKIATQNLLKTMVLTIEAEGETIPEAIQTNVLDKMVDAFEAGQDYEGAKAAGQAMIDAYLSVDETVVESKIAEVVALRGQIIEALIGTGDDAEGIASVSNSILDSIIGTDVQEQAFTRAAELKKKIAQGLATASEMDQYDAISKSIIANLDAAKEYIDQNYDARSEGAQQAKQSIDDLAESYEKSAKSIQEEAMAAEAVGKSLEDAASALRSVSGSFDGVKKSISEVADMKAAVNAITDYTNKVDTSAEAAQRAADAREWLAKKYGVEADAIQEIMPSIMDDIEMKEALALADYAVGMQAALMAQAQITAMISAGTVTQDQGQKMINALQGVIDKMAEIGNTTVTLTAGGNGMPYDVAAKISGRTINAAGKVPSTGGSSGGGGGSTKTNSTLDNHLAMLSRKKALDQLTTDEEIAGYEKALSSFAKTTAEKQELTEKLYALKKQKAEEDLEFQKSMDQLTLREEIAAYDQLIAAMKQGSPARRELEQQRYEAARELEQQEFDLKVYYGQLTLEQQADELKKMIATYKEGTEARIELEKQLYDAEKALRQKNIDNVNTMLDAITTALKAKYEEQRDAELKKLDDSAKAWEDWGKSQTESIQKQIDALDKLADTETAADEESKKRRKVAMLEQALLYETDEYNKRKISEQIKLAQSELDTFLKEQERKRLKESLQDQLDAVNESVDAETAKINAQKDKVNESYDAATKKKKLEAEAEKLLLKGQQDEILTLLKQYAEDYNLTGKTLGERLVDGFKGAVGSISDWFDGLVTKFGAWQQSAASAANGAADSFLVEHGSAKTVDNSRTFSPMINIYTTGDSGTPAEIRRELMRTLEGFSTI